MTQREERLIHELALLQKPKWRWSDIKDFAQCGSRQANEMRKLALQHNGIVASDKHAVRPQAVMELLGTTIEYEIKKRGWELGINSPERKATNG